MSPHLPPSLLQMLRPTSPDRTDKATSDRHFVTWTDQEDDILRQAVTIYGVDKWSVIAAQFCNKTSRQCRRRWHTYLSTDCKKGGWSPEEDQLLLEAHRRFGNRWTEIAKVVPGRTDNAVKNRFSALGKKQAKKSNVPLGHSNAEDMKGAFKRKVLEPNTSIANKRSRGDYIQFLSHQSTLHQQPKHHPIQVKQSFPTWTPDQSMAHRAHPVHNEKLRKDLSFTSSNRILQDSKSMQNKRAMKGLSVDKCGSNKGIDNGTLQASKSFTENISPPRLAALNQNAALLDSLVERRDARLKIWGGIDDTWKPFDLFSMEDGCKMQAANYISGNHSVGDIKISFYEGKENYIDPSCQSPYGGQMPVSLPINQEPFNQHKLPDLGTKTPTMQHERTWKVRSELEGLDCSSPSNGISYQTDDSTPLQIECFSSVPVDQPFCDDHNEAEMGVTCSTDCQGLRTQGEGGGSTLMMDDAGTDDHPHVDFTWDPQFFMDEMPSPQFSDSEKQFLLSALDSSYQTFMFESHVLGSNMSMASFCTS